MTTHSSTLRSPGRVLTAVAECFTLEPDSAFLGLVHRPSTRQRVVAVKRLSTPAVVDDWMPVRDEVYDVIMGGVTTLPRGRAYTRADLETMPDDGHRYELVDGTLVVTPAPSLRHQVVVVNLVVALNAACTEELRVLTAPFDVALGLDTVLQPDVLVARRSDLTAQDLPTAPVVAVEVLSPSTRRVDLTLKRSRYEAAGCPSYWVVDPDQPSVTVWELRDGSYVEVAHAEGNEVLDVVRPFPVALTATQLLA